MLPTIRANVLMVAREYYNLSQKRPFGAPLQLYHEAVDVVLMSSQRHSHTAVASTSMSMSGCISEATPIEVMHGSSPALECFWKNSTRAGIASRCHFSRSVK